MTKFPPPLRRDVWVMLVVWSVILIPWIPCALIGSFVAFEPGDSLKAYTLLAAMWTYPALVGIAYFALRRNPNLVYLPVLSLILLGLS